MPHGYGFSRSLMHRICADPCQLFAHKANSTSQRTANAGLNGRGTPLLNGVNAESQRQNRRTDTIIIHLQAAGGGNRCQICRLCAAGIFVSLPLFVLHKQPLSMLSYLFVGHLVLLWTLLDFGCAINKICKEKQISHARY